MRETLKVLVVDDMVTQRNILAKAMSEVQGIELIGSAPNGKIALAKIGIRQPDLVLTDMFMPEMDGLETLTQIKLQYPNVEVIMLTAINHQMADLTMKALDAGALDFILKPTGKSADESIRHLRTELSRLILLVMARKYARQIRGISSAKETEFVRPSIISEPECFHFQKSGRNIPKIEVVVIGVSTGGPNALQEIIPKLPKNFSLPILAVQHMPPMFTASLASRLNQLSNIRVKEAQDGDKIEKGVMYIAPGGHHLVVRKGSLGVKMVGIVDSPPVHSCRPAADVLFRSVAITYGGNALSVILTGMGNDGTAGVAAIRRKGGYSIVQDAKTSVIWGMPGSVVDAGEADEIISLDCMSSKITELAAGGHRC